MFLFVELKRECGAGGDVIADLYKRSFEIVTYARSQRDRTMDFFITFLEQETDLRVLPVVWNLSLCYDRFEERLKFLFSSSQTVEWYPVTCSFDIHRETEGRSLVTFFMSAVHFS